MRHRVNGSSESQDTGPSPSHLADIDEQRVVVLAKRVAREALDAGSYWNETDHKLSFRHLNYGVNRD